VFTPTLTGLGERAHLLHPGIDASLHIADVVNVIKYERLDDFVLVGHSYGGCVISGIAEAMPGAIRSIVFLDAFIPDNGDSTLDLVQPAVQEVIRAALARGEPTVPVRDAAAFKVNEKDRAWVDAFATPAADWHHDRKAHAHGRPRSHSEEDVHPRVRLSERIVREGLRTREGRPDLAQL
jgi:pimeloyl-ACP methyl ester carboxylesterase